MTTYGMPLFLEDTTGLITGSDYFDIYDRPPFLHLVQTIRQDRIISQIFELGSSPNTYGRNQARSQEPSVILEFSPDHSLGTIAFGRSHSRTMAMERYLKKHAGFGSSLIRIFRASDGVDYTWGFHTLSDQEWTCVNPSTHELIAHYDLKPPNEPVYRTSGNVLTVYERFQHLAVELLASLTIMRHIAEHGL